MAEPERWVQAEETQSPSTPRVFSQCLVCSAECVVDVRTDSIVPRTGGGSRCPAVVTPSSPDVLPLFGPPSLPPHTDKTSARALTQCHSEGQQSGSSPTGWTACFSGHSCPRPALLPRDCKGQPQPACVLTSLCPLS